MTYSPEDNKLRLYPLSRLDAETYAQVKSAGFSWAPKQELFVAPAWTSEDQFLEIRALLTLGDRGISIGVQKILKSAHLVMSFQLARAIRGASISASLAGGPLEFIAN